MGLFLWLGEYRQYAGAVRSISKHCAGVSRSPTSCCACRHAGQRCRRPGKALNPQLVLAGRQGLPQVKGDTRFPLIATTDHGEQPLIPIEGPAGVVHSMAAGSEDAIALDHAGDGDEEHLSSPTFKRHIRDFVRAGDLGRRIRIGGVSHIV